MRLFVATAMLICAVSSVRADVVEIGEFVGDNSENFNSFQGGLGGHSTLDIFDGDVTLVKGEGGSIKIEFSSSRGGDLVVPRSNPVFMGQFEEMQWFFHTPINKFGGYFENNSRFDDVVVNFFDAQDQLIDTVMADVPKDAQVWTWNGWQSDTPIHRITTAGNDVVFQHGFVWFDDMEISYAAAVPEPTTTGALGLAAIAIALRRRNRHLADD